MDSTGAFQQIDPSIEVSHSNNPASVAYLTARTRWPRVIVGAIAEVTRTLSGLTHGSVEKQDGEYALQDLKNLLSELNNNAAVPPMPEDGASDIGDFNKELEFLGPLTWHNSPWLYTECYLYRRIQNCFSQRQTPFWKAYDVFSSQKTHALTSSKTVVVELVQWFLEVANKIKHVTNEEDLKALIEEFIQVSLWGNASDLLILLNVSMEELQSRQGEKSRGLLKENVVSDNTDEVWKLLAPLPKRENDREIHVILDNAGFEFLTDLVFVAYLLAANYATTIVLHGKAFPWFVSDATAQDMEITLDTLEHGRFDTAVSADESRDLRQFSTIIQEHFKSGKLRYEANPFWTTQHSYARMEKLAPELHKSLTNAELIIFKGDLNYRKLVFDGMWPRTTTFQQAIGTLGMPKKDGLRILSLRTCKADTCVGLQEGKEKEIDPLGTSEWSRNGKYAVISYYDAKAFV